MRPAVGEERQVREKPEGQLAKEPREGQLAKRDAERQSRTGAEGTSQDELAVQSQQRSAEESSEGRPVKMSWHS